MESASEQLYKEHILDHCRHPRFFGALEAYSHTHRRYNPLCGDVVTLYIRAGKGRIEAASFEGSGCAISIAAASLLMEYIQGKDTTALRGMSEDTMIDLLGVTIYEARIPCALLPFHTLRACLA